MAREAIHVPFGSSITHSSPDALTRSFLYSTSYRNARAGGHYRAAGVSAVRSDRLGLPLHIPRGSSAGHLQVRGFFIHVPIDDVRFMAPHPIAPAGLAVGLAGFLLEHFLVRNLASRVVCFGLTLPILSFFGFMAILLFDGFPPKPAFRITRSASAPYT